MKKLLVRPLYYPDRAHQLLGQDRLVPRELLKQRWMRKLHTSEPAKLQAGT